ncbi:MAG: glutamate-cysteine ligase family protein [Spirochaetota bacterium]
MGKEVHKRRFTAEDFSLFATALRRETEVLRNLITDGQCCERDEPSIGYELEGWILDHRYVPAAKNEQFLRSVAHPRVVPELSRFNMEINGEPRAFAAGSLRGMHAEMQETWRACQQAAHAQGLILLLIGTLPTIRESDLSLKNISRMNRYHALNERIFEERGGKPVHVRIEGKEVLDTYHEDCLLEAGTTSFQLHLALPQRRFADYYNASQLLSAPLIAACANSPYLFHHDLWSETRVPLFEQAVETSDGSDRHRLRVLFGSRWLERADEIFSENHDLFKPLLPILLEELEDSLPHLRLHNGTIWRWNRIIPGFVPGEAPRLRIEHRILPAGPSIVDMVANAALYFGAVTTYAKRMAELTATFPFADCENNFYHAAKEGLGSRLLWPGAAAELDVVQLLLQEILPAAAEGLAEHGIAQEESDFYLGIIRQRLYDRQTGAEWQRRFVAKHGKKWEQLTTRYLENQRSGFPVHEWDL